MNKYLLILILGFIFLFPSCDSKEEVVFSFSQSEVEKMEYPSIDISFISESSAKIQVEFAMPVINDIVLYYENLFSTNHIYPSKIDGNKFIFELTGLVDGSDYIVNLYGEKKDRIKYSTPMGEISFDIKYGEGKNTFTTKRIPEKEKPSVSIKEVSKSSVRVDISFPLEIDSDNTFLELIPYFKDDSNQEFVAMESLGILAEPIYKGEKSISFEINNLIGDTDYVFHLYDYDKGRDYVSYIYDSGTKIAVKVDKELYSFHTDGLSNADKPSINIHDITYQSAIIDFDFNSLRCEDKNIELQYFPINNPLIFKKAKPTITNSKLIFELDDLDESTAYEFHFYLIKGDKEYGKDYISLIENGNEFISKIVYPDNLIRFKTKDLTTIYSSPLAVKNGFDDGWTTADIANYWIPTNWTSISDYTTIDYEGNGYAAYIDYYKDRKADAWLISPPIYLEGGKEYIITDYLKSSYYGGDYIKLYIDTSDTPDLIDRSNKYYYHSLNFYHDKLYNRNRTIITCESSNYYHFCFRFETSLSTSSRELYLTGFSVKTPN